MTEYRITVAQKQGSRVSQEDRSFSKHFKFPQFECWLLAVMDGHGGSLVAEHCMREIPDMLVISGPEDVEKQLRSLISRLHGGTRNHTDGSTISLACVFEDSENQMKVITAVLGDSPIIVLDDQNEFYIGPEHNVRVNPFERKAIIDRGGIYDHVKGYVRVCSGSGGLQLSRALGDVAFDAILSREPEIRIIRNPKWVLVASDGLIRHSQAPESFQEIKKNAEDGFSADDLMELAELRGLSDNTTAVVWQ